MGLTSVTEPKEITTDYVDYVVTKGIQMGIVDSELISEWRKLISERSSKG